MIDEQEALSAVLTFTGFSSAQLKKKRRGKRDFHPLLVKLPGLCPQHCLGQKPNNTLLLENSSS